MFYSEANDLVKLEFAKDLTCANVPGVRPWIPTLKPFLHRHILTLPATFACLNLRFLAAPNLPRSSPLGCIHMHLQVPYLPKPCITSAPEISWPLPEGFTPMNVERCVQGACGEVAKKEGGR